MVAENFYLFRTPSRNTSEVPFPTGVPIRYPTRPYKAHACHARCPSDGLAEKHPHPQCYPVFLNATIFPLTKWTGGSGDEADREGNTNSERNCFTLRIHGARRQLCRACCRESCATASLENRLTANIVSMKDPGNEVGSRSAVYRQILHEHLSHFQ